MGKLLKELGKFLSTAIPEQLEQAWKEVEPFKDVGPTITKYIESMEEIKEAYCNYEVAQLLKEKGFDELCILKYNSDGIKVKAGQAIDEWSNTELEEDECSAPTHQMACAWVRKKYNLYICPKLACFCGGRKSDKEYYEWEDRVLKLTTNNQVHPQFAEIHKYYDTYEEAVEAGLKFVLTEVI